MVPTRTSWGMETPRASGLLLLTASSLVYSLSKYCAERLILRITASRSFGGTASQFWVVVPFAKRHHYPILRKMDSLWIKITVDEFRHEDEEEEPPVQSQHLPRNHWRGQEEP